MKQFQGPFSVSAAEELSSHRGGGFTSTNTVLEEASAYDKVFFHGFGNKVVSRNKVRTVQCQRSYGGSWSGT